MPTLWNGPHLHHDRADNRRARRWTFGFLGSTWARTAAARSGWTPPTGRAARRLRRESVVALAAKLPGCVVAMEACCGAHHLGRQLAAQGNQVRLMSPEYVRPYVKAQKNDHRDADAIAEAATRPTMRFVALKTQAQLDVQVLHRVRDRLVGQRTALTNQRSILPERGIGSHRADAGCSTRWRHCPRMAAR
jgi:transposase